MSMKKWLIAIVALIALVISLLFLDTITVAVTEALRQVGISLGEVEV